MYSPRCIHFVADHLFPQITGQEDCELNIKEDWVFVENEKEDEDGFMIVREMRWEYVRVREGGQVNLTIYSTFFLMV